MSKLIAFILFTSVAVGSFSQTVKKDYYDYRKTQIMAEYQVNSVGEKHGWFKGYNQEGVLVYEYNYKNNLQDGVNKEYSVYGGRTLSQSETYKAGVLDGAAIYYAGTGSTKGRFVKAQGSYKNGEREGDWVLMESFDSYGFSDEVKKGAQYTKGTFRYEGGKIVYPDGEFKAYYYPSGKTYIIGSYLNGKMVGDHIQYNPDGTIKAQQHFSTAEETKIMEEKAKIEEEKAKIQRQIDKEKRAEALIFANKTLDSNKVEEAIKLYQNIGVNTEYLELFLVLKQKYEKGEIELGTTSIQYDDEGNIRTSNTMGSKLGSMLTNNYFRGVTPKEHEDYCLHYLEIKKLEKLEIENINKEVQVSFDAYINENVNEVKTTVRDPNTGEFITNKTYLKNKIIYTKSIIVLEGYIEVFKSASLVTMKKELGKKLIDSINTLNQIPESEWKDLSKQLKKIGDPEQIKAILKI
jgi:antitoxin component YwqK of YwqJK toxin-antitoxin module